MNALTEPTITSRKGDRVEFDKMIKYVPYDGWTRTQPPSIYRHIVGTVTGIIAWADNSTDVEILTDDGDTVREQVMYPHGDACF